MEKYILELIAENNRVIIPNFGAFIVSKEHGTSVLFNNFLSFNDGLLVNYVAEQKGIDTIVATDQVFEYVDQLKHKLEESGTYTIDQLGSFSKDDNGILRFQQADNFIQLLGHDGAEPSDENSGMDNKEVDDSSKRVFILDVEQEDEDSLRNESQAREESSVINQSEETDAELGDKEDELNSAKSPSAASQQPDSKVAESRKVQLKMPSPRKEAERKNKNSGIVIFVVVAAIILLSVGVYFVFFDKPKEVEKKVVKKSVVLPKVKAPEVKDTVAMTPIVQKATPVQKEEKTESMMPQKGRIYIIVGGFKEKENAHKMVSKLKSKGHVNAQVIEKDNLLLVSVDSDMVYEKMEAKQQELLQEEMESWLYTGR